MATPAVSIRPGEESGWQVRLESVQVTMPSAEPPVMLPTTIVPVAALRAAASEAWPYESVIVPSSVPQPVPENGGA